MKHFQSCIGHGTLTFRCPMLGIGDFTCNCCDSCVIRCQAKALRLSEEHKIKREQQYRDDMELALKMKNEMKYSWLEGATIPCDGRS